MAPSENEFDIPAREQESPHESSKYSKGTSRFTDVST